MMGKCSITMLEAKDIKGILGISLGSVYKLMNRPDFPSIRVSDRRFVVPETAFRKWIDEQTEAKITGINICMKCGKRFKSNKPSSTKYCPECGKQIRAQQNRERVRRFRDRNKGGDQDA